MSDVVVKTMTGGMGVYRVESGDDPTISARPRTVGRIHLTRTRASDRPLEHQRQVVVLAGVADECVDFAEDALAQLLERQFAVLLDERGKPLLAERLPSAFIASVTPSVNSSTTSPARGAASPPRAGSRTARRCRSSGRARGRPGACTCTPRPATPTSPPAGARLRQIDQRAVARPRVGERPRAHVDHRIRHRDEAARVEMLRR